MILQRREICKREICRKNTNKPNIWSVLPLVWDNTERKHRPIHPLCWLLLAGLPKPGRHDFCVGNQSSRPAYLRDLFCGFLLLNLVNLLLSDIWKEFPFSSTSLVRFRFRWKNYMLKKRSWSGLDKLVSVHFFSLHRTGAAVITKIKIIISVRTYKWWDTRCESTRMCIRHTTLCCDAGHRVSPTGKILTF